MSHKSDSVVSSASVSEQLQYWIGQTSLLSDSLIESQLRRSEAESALEQLRPLQHRLPTLELEMRSLSQAKADALVENQRLSEWAESLRSLTHRQEEELVRLRQLSSQQETSNASLTAQLQAAHQTGTSLTSAMQLQQAYATKLAAVESSLATAQQEVASHSELKFHYQILHAKYVALKKSHTGADGLAASVSQENAQYRQQMTDVCRELEEVRRDLLAREEEREKLLTRVVTLTESEQELQKQNQQLQEAVHRLTHGGRIARARVFQQVEKLREFQSRVKVETQSLLDSERRNQHAIFTEILSHLARTQSKHHLNTSLLHQHLREDQEVHTRQMQQADEKMMQLIQYTTGPAARRSQPQSMNASTAAALPSESYPPLPSLPPAHGLIQSVANHATNFDVRQWLLNESKLHSNIPSHNTSLNVSNVSHLNHSLGRSRVGHSTSTQPASSVGQSPSHIHTNGGRQLVDSVPPIPPTFSLPSSLASSIHANDYTVASLPPSHPPSTNHSPFMQHMNAPTIPSIPLVTAWPLGENVASTVSDQLTDQMQAQARSNRITRGVHAQRLAEVEAALMAMEKVN